MDRLLRLAEVRNLIPYCRSTIYHKVSLGEFPAPINMGAKPGSAVVWRESEIRAWIAERIKASGGAQQAA
jgi:prophage regulatory protein